MNAKRDQANCSCTCHVCGQPYPETQVRPFSSVRPGVSDTIAKTVPGWDKGKSICKPDLTRFRRLYVERLLELERGELGDLDRQVIASLDGDGTIARNTEDDLSSRETVGDIMADRVSEFGGSWAFIIGFFVLLVVWMVSNAFLLGKTPFDPYPFIFLNLVLSCVAAFQAPIIMMSQRRKDAKDRMRSENDYRVNLKSELEIRLLHEKIDHQLAHQWDRLAELQQIQIDLLEDALNDRR